MTKLMKLNKEKFLDNLLYGNIQIIKPRSQYEGAMYYDIFHEYQGHDGKPVVFFEKEEKDGYIFSVYNYTDCFWYPEKLFDLKVFKETTEEGVAMNFFGNIFEELDSYLQEIYWYINESFCADKLCMGHKEYHEYPGIEYIQLPFYRGVSCNIQKLSFPRLTGNNKKVSLGIYYS